MWLENNNDGRMICDGLMEGGRIGCYSLVALLWIVGLPCCNGNVRSIELLKTGGSSVKIETDAAVHWVVKRVAESPLSPSPN